MGRASQSSPRKKNESTLYIVVQPTYYQHVVWKYVVLIPNGIEPSAVDTGRYVSVSLASWQLGRHAVRGAHPVLHYVRFKMHSPREHKHFIFI